MENHYYCIYKYTNKLNNKSYIGRTYNFLKRHRQHLKGYSLKQSYFERAIQKYGIENFEIEILCEFPKSEDINELLNSLEMYYIWKYDSFNKGYNLTKGGDGFGSGKDCIHWKNYPRIVKTKNNRYLLFDHESNIIKETYYMEWLIEITKHMNYGKVELLGEMFEINQDIVYFDEEKHLNDLKIKQREVLFQNVHHQNKGIYHPLAGKNTSGVLHVSIDKQPKCENGFYWRYRFKDNNKWIKFVSVKLSKLEEKVKQKGYEWIITDEDKYKYNLENY